MIYVLGSLNIDLVAGLDRLPKKGETISAGSFFINCGGKGANQAIAARKMGAEVCMIGHIGADDFGRRLKKKLQDENVNTRCVTAVDGNSGIAMILLEGGDNRIILNSGANSVWSEAEIDLALSSAKEGDLLVCQLEIPMHIVEYAFILAKKKRMVTVLNPAPAQSITPLIYQNTDIITPNETETQILTEVNPIDIVHVALAVKKFYSYGVKCVVITLGANGSVCTDGNNITEIPPYKVNVLDTTAAGDTYIGAICERLTRGFHIVDACRFASAASAITIQRLGASDSIPTYDEVIRFLASK